jgi:hypothetical protein
MAFETLIFATPMLKIEQAVGRMRGLTEATPLVIDIVDNHHIFKRQYRERSVFYRKQLNALI